MPNVYETLSGHRIEYPELEPKLARFLARVQAAAAEPGATTATLAALVYGPENPLLDFSFVPGRGAITRETLEHPVYRVMSDIVHRADITPEQAQRMAAKHTLTVAEAAARLGVSEEAVRKGIRERRVPSWVKDGQYFLDPRNVDVLTLGARGPIPAHVEPLAYSVGFRRSAQGETFLRVLTPEKELEGEGQLARWRYAAVLTGGHGKLRLFKLEPGDKDNEFVFHGCYVKGRFTITEKVNDAKRAQARWEGLLALWRGVAPRRRGLDGRRPQ